MATNHASRPALVFDIETVGDVTDTNRAEITPLATKREQEPEAYAALCPPLARVACIAWFHTANRHTHAAFDATLPAGDRLPNQMSLMDPTTGATDIECAITSCENERHLIETFCAAVEAHLATPKSCLVSYSGRNFDLPVLIHRGLIAGARNLSPLVRLMRENRFTPSQHIDLLDTVTFNGVGSRWPLAAYVIGHGARSPKNEMDGAQVGDAVRSGQLADVVRYCATDVLATALLYERCAPLVPAERK